MVVRTYIYNGVWGPYDESGQQQLIKWVTNFYQTVTNFFLLLGLSRSNILLMYPTSKAERTARLVRSVVGCVYDGLGQDVGV